eukprot:TRINITY_DN3965_c0_g1_i5.p1 TRINITY_DN3965_c0_g1~~TRINITY_DN3965_c0_g1_i5.p1  ORF type:complete len:106 (+),score=18.21 TRINITY_DN3965_c0_g1_i5:75-392(+)
MCIRDRTYTLSVTSGKSEFMFGSSPSCDIVIEYLRDNHFCIQFLMPQMVWILKNIDGGGEVFILGSNDQSQDQRQKIPSLSLAHGMILGIDSGSTQWRVEIVESS